MRVILLSSLVALIAGCSHNPGEPGGQAQSLPPIQPDYCNVVMPCNMALPSFMVDGATHMRAEVGWGGQTVTVDGECEVCLDDAARGMESRPSTIDVTVSVWDETHPDGVRYAPFTITFSPDSIDSKITYRLIPPGYEGWNTMGIYERRLSSYDETPIVVIDGAGQGCVNCHTPAWGNPHRTLYHKRGEGGGTHFSIDGKDAFLNLKDLGLQGSYPAWHPGGRYIAFANTDTHQSFYHRSSDKIEVYDLGGKLFIYDTQTKAEMLDERFNDSTLFHTFPAFSPDGSTLYFCRAKAVDMPHHTDSLHYALIAARFDPSTAALGEEQVIVPATDHTSVSFPRVSPDGRYLMYTLSHCGTFPIWHKEADLAMIDLSTGLPVDISALNSDDVESYHSWDSSGRWVVLSSRRADGRYTRLYFAHVDERGGVSRPFMLPQRSPMHDLMLLDSYNVPEFMK